jgi:hypothetical protein
MPQSAEKLSQDPTSASPGSGKQPNYHPQKSRVAWKNYAGTVARFVVHANSPAIFKAKTSAPPSDHPLRFRARCPKRPFGGLAPPRKIKKRGVWKNAALEGLRFSRQSA